MSDFGELCPLFNTGVYNEIYLGQLTGTQYISTTFNFLSSPGDPATAPSSFRFGRTVVITNCWFRRMVANTTDSISLFIGRRTGSGTAEQSLFGTLTQAEDPTTFPDIRGAWQQIKSGGVSILTSFTVNTADVLDISMYSGAATTTQGAYDVVVQYREK